MLNNLSHWGNEILHHNEIATINEAEWVIYIYIKSDNTVLLKMRNKSGTLIHCR